MAPRVTLIATDRSDQKAFLGLEPGRTDYKLATKRTHQFHSMFEILSEWYPWLFFLGCYVHVLDLLIEDIAKIPAFASLGRDAHFLESRGMH